MFKKILCLCAVLTIISFTGCSLVSKAQETGTTTPASVRMVREATISKIWKMKQMEINLDKEVSITMELKDGDKVEGYFYLVKGESTAFSISGNSLIYSSKSTDTETMRITSDRFSFTSAQTQGMFYKLTLNAAASSNGKTGETTVFLELIYPVTASLYVPIGTK